MKFTPGRPRHRRACRDDGERAVLEVRDTGIGMSPDVVAHVFERFYPVDPARSSASGGAGLGLSLVKWIVDRHHGTVSVENTPEKGSTFRVALPAFTHSYRILTRINLPFHTSLSRFTSPSIDIRISSPDSSPESRSRIPESDPNPGHGGSSCGQ